MVCKCVTEEGAPSLHCDGTCSASRMINPEKQERAMEDSFTPNQLQQIKMIVQEALCVAPALDKVWVDGFLKGFDEGKSYGNY